MSGGAASYNVSKAADIVQILEEQELKEAQVEAVLKNAADDKVWAAIQGLIGKDVSDDDLVAAIGAGQDANDVLPYIPMPKKVNPNDPDVIEIAKFAVKNGGPGLDFIKVASGIKWNVVAATFYALLIQTQDNVGIHWNKALIVEFITGHKKLIWYKK